ncbi:hypothetical protein [Niabella hibiscisoli]|uniref:hypothetical protein n=1 Tax=Niabella hibiscisoli TaxID=1825928 RepID=UPI001F0DDCFD|nr:hypothetical protein [Niabella hibiscisoli]MCH5718592.1 hypothetical protein [Niabella hibiscisoli]
MLPYQVVPYSRLALACWAGLYITLQACTLDNYPLKAESSMISTGGYAAGLTAKTCARKGQHRSSIKNGYPNLSKDSCWSDDLIQADNLSGDSIRHNEDRNNHHPPSIDLLYAS